MEQKYINKERELLLDYKVVNSSRVSEVYTYDGHIIEEAYGKEFLESSMGIHKLVMKVVSGINEEFKDYKAYIPDFPFKEEIIAMKSPLEDFLWTRYDGFLKEEGLFYSEFNYDKPCAQRECQLMEDKIENGSNLTNGFMKSLKENLLEILNRRFPNKAEYNIAFLTAPSRYEETHLALFLKQYFEVELEEKIHSDEAMKPVAKGFNKIQKYKLENTITKSIDKKLSVTLVGPTNLYVEQEKVKGFNKVFDAIIRLYPTEFMYECPSFKEILQLQEAGEILILNDPRAIFAQGKGLYAYLWGLVQSDDNRLTEGEKILVRKYLPYTELLNKNNLEKVRKLKDLLVVKPVFGRYSIDVFIGTLHTEEEWTKSMDYVESIMDEKAFIFQSFQKIREENTLYDDGRLKKQIEGFGNYGIFLSKGKAIGSCIRWCPDYITEEENTWISPVGIGQKYLRVYDILKNKENQVEHTTKQEIQKDNTEKLELDSEALYKEILSNQTIESTRIEKIRARALIEHGFSGVYAKNYEYLSVNPLIIKEEKLNELKEATEDLAKIFNKTQNAIKENIDVFEEILCLKGLASSIKKETIQEFCFLGRMDWIIDKWGNLKVLEINSETPAGVIEALELQKEYLNIFMEDHEKQKLIDPNRNLKDLIKSQGRKIITQCESIKEVKTIAIVGCTYYEDWYTMKGIYELLKEEFGDNKIYEQPGEVSINKLKNQEDKALIKDIDREKNIIMGNIKDLQLEGQEVYLYGNKIDAIYRYYPLDWFKEDDDLEKILEKLNETVFSLNPVSTIISQSKGFFPAIYELMKHNFYTTQEEEIIKKYIPLTTYDYRELQTLDFVLKPMLGREGSGVSMSHELKEIPEEDVVFQQLVYSETLRVKVTSNLDSWKENLYPVIGTYVVGEKFGGVFTRLGGKITKNICMYTPLFGEKGDE